MAPTELKRALGRTRRNHPALPFLHRHGLSVTGLAVFLDEPRGTVSSWFGTGEHARPIPLYIAERLRDLYGVPVTAWEKVRGASADLRAA